MLFIHSFPSTYLQVKPGAQITCKCVAFWCFHKLTLSVEAARELSGGRAGGRAGGGGGPGGRTSQGSRPCCLLGFLHAFLTTLPPHRSEMLTVQQRTASWRSIVCRLGEPRLSLDRF